MPRTSQQNFHVASREGRVSRNFKQEEKSSGNKGFFPLGPKGQEGTGSEGRMTMKEAIAAKLNMNQEGKGE